MRRRSLGRTGVRVSVLGFGCAPLGGEYGSVDESELAETLNSAVDRGINFFDTAPYYGRTSSEERLGRALAGRRDEVVLATKCCRFDLRGFDFSAERVRSDVEASLRRLRTDRVDLLQVHDVEFGRREVILGETLPALREAQAAGKARFIGITGLPVAMLADIAREFEIDSVLSYCHYNLLVRDLDRVLRPVAEERGIALLNASPLHMGLLTETGPPAWHPAPPEVKAAGRALAAACRARGRNVAEVALAFALRHQGVASTLVGMRTVAELERNLAVAEGALDDAIDATLAAEIDALVAPVLDRTWHDGLPENAPKELG